MSSTLDVTNLPSYRFQRALRDRLPGLGVENPFYRLHAGRASDTSVMDDQVVINFSSYDYLGMNGHERIVEAAIATMRKYGTTVSASRTVSGERPFHADLERLLAANYEVDDALTFVSGYATNVALIDALVDEKDLILYDEFAHNSILTGARLSGATMISFSHNNLANLEEKLQTVRPDHRNCMIIVEGMYSMHGDVSDLPALIDIKARYGAWLMVDEAHGLGVLGELGRGAHEHWGINSSDVDIWMGTLSKTLVSSGGYVAGSSQLIDMIRSTANGFIYSVGLAPPNAGAAAEALKLMYEQPDRVRRLRANSQFLKRTAEEQGLDTGSSIGEGIVPLTVGNPSDAVVLSGKLLAEGINISPIMFPAVPYDKAILRCFVSASHSVKQMEQLLAAFSRLRSELANV